MRKTRFWVLVIAALVLFAAEAPTAVRASTYDYSMTLTALVGTDNGSGSFSINLPTNSPSGTLTVGNGLAGSVTIGGVTIALNSLSSVSYSYLGPTLLLTGFFSGEIPVTNGIDTLVSMTFGTTAGSVGGFSFTDSANSKLSSSGIVSVSQTPLPTSFPLLATGLAILAMLGWYRNRRAPSYLAA